MAHRRKVLQQSRRQRDHFQAAAGIHGSRFDAAENYGGFGLSAVLPLTSS